MVAQVLEIRSKGDNYQFVTELIPGASPKSNEEIEGMLDALYSYFQEVGLPTWQISPSNPHAYSNFIRTPHGELKLIDLESALTSISAPRKQLGAFARDAHYPVFDDVDFVQLRGYARAHALELEKSLGRAGFEDLQQTVEKADTYTHQWKDGELRLWGRLASRVYRLLDMRRFVDPIRRRMVNPEAAAMAFATAGIERWEREGRIDRERAGSLEALLATSEAKTLLRHLGAHVALSVALPFPIPGLRSAARFTWTLAFRLKALWALARRGITTHEYRKAQSIHSIPVMLIALLPGFGAIAYTASYTTMRKGLGRLLVDQAAYKMPFGLYRHLGLARITAPQLLKPMAECPVCHTALAYRH
jgi:hypothetical protein